MLSAHPEMNLIVGSDQGIEGAVQAIGKKKITLVGYGGSAAALQGVGSGAWFGDVAQLPASEGRLAVLAAVKAVQDGTKGAGVHPVASLPNAGVVTKDKRAAVHGGVARVERPTATSRSRTSPGGSGGVLALDNVSLTIEAGLDPRARGRERRGEVHAREDRGRLAVAGRWAACSCAAKPSRFARRTRLSRAGSQRSRRSSRSCRSCRWKQNVFLGVGASPRRWW